METTTTRPVPQRTQTYQTQCVACGAPLAAHFREEQWTGCPGARTMPAPKGMFVPVVMLVAPMRVLSSGPTTTTPVPDVEPDVEPEVDAESTPTPSKRGRRPSRYVVATAPDAPLTGALGKVFQIVSKRKRGVEARDVAEKLHMSPGTVGWALGKLIRIGHVQHAQPRTNRAA